MHISAHIHNSGDNHQLVVQTGSNTRHLSLPAKATAPGSAVNGGELLMAALATCYCNDLYREAARLGIPVDGCEVVASAQFNGIGLGAESVVYRARVASPAAPADIEHLLSEADRLAEIHNTLRSGCPVQRLAWEDGAPSTGDTPCHAPSA